MLTDRAAVLATRADVDRLRLALARTRTLFEIRESAAGPEWAAISPITPFAWERPRPLAGAGAFSTPVDVWPKRRTVHVPAGTSQAMRPSSLIEAVRSTIRSRAIVAAAGSSASAAGGTSQRS